MEKIDQQLNNLSNTDVPIGVHHSVMRKVNYERIKPVLFIAFTLLILNFIVIVWHINSRLVDAQFVDMGQDFFEIFGFSFSFMNTMLVSFFETIPLVLILSAVFSFAGAVYTGKKINTYRLSGI